MSTFEFWYDHVGVSVPDLEQAIQWWEHVLDFKLERRNAIDAIPAQIAILKNGNLRVELFEVPGAKAASEERFQPNQDVRTHGNKHISFAVEDVVALSEAIRARGADIVWVKTFTFGSNMFIRDNAGNLIEFVQRPKPMFEASTLQAGHGDHV
ncbi:VOC family protein [Massilia putida]|uniref:VOC family protein n=1 Tax=Massilia putida TaxID=1141883 RepID=UPI0009525FF3|nr:VOC family protein [Massilia putida]